MGDSDSIEILVIGGLLTAVVIVGAILLFIEDHL